MRLRSKSQVSQSSDSESSSVRRSASRSRSPRRKGRDSARSSPLRSRSPLRASQTSTSLSTRSERGRTREQPEDRQPDGEVGETEAEPQAIEGSRPGRVGKDDTRRLRELMACGTPRLTLKDLREDFAPRFEHRSFELKCPELDDSMLRRLRMEHPREKAATEAKEKAFLQHQRKILDVGRPIIEVWAQLEKTDPIRDALEASLQLWGEAFHSVTK